jgi:hypothetical protein
MSSPMNCQLIGRWRIVEADIWDCDYLDLCGPATIEITADGHGEIAWEHAKSWGVSKFLNTKLRAFGKETALWRSWFGG